MVFHHHREGLWDTSDWGRCPSQKRFERGTRGRQVRGAAHPPGERSQSEILSTAKLLPSTACSLLPGRRDCAWERAPQQFCDTFPRTDVANRCLHKEVVSYQCVPSSWRIRLCLQKGIRAMLQFSVSQIVSPLTPLLLTVFVCHPDTLTCYF